MRAAVVPLPEEARRARQEDGRWTEQVEASKSRSGGAHRRLGWGKLQNPRGCGCSDASLQNAATAEPLQCALFLV
jgi:hypothetical protein